MKKTMTIKKITFISSTFTLIFVLALGILSNLTVNQVVLALEKSHYYSIPAINNILQADRDLQQLMVSERTMLYTENGTSSYLGLQKDYSKNLKQASDRIKKYEDIAESKEEKKLLKEYWLKFESWKKDSQQVLELRNQANTTSLAQAIELSKGQAAKSFEQMRDKLDQIQEFVITTTASDEVHATQTSKQANLILLSLMALTFFCALFSAYFMYRKLTTILYTVSSNLSHASTQLLNQSEGMTSATNNVQSLLESQTSSVTQTAASVQEISAMVTRNSENATGSVKQAQETTKLAQDGQESTLKMTSSVESIYNISNHFITELQNNTEEINRMLEIINEINTKTKVINDIVFQTKLLSFNASVEAARAGEHGKGFSVVAEEIGNLANMSGTASSEITDLLDSSLEKVGSIVTQNKSIVSAMSEKVLSEVNTGKEVSVSCRNILEKVVNQMTSLNTSIDQIAVSSDEQATGVSEINTAIRQMDDAISNLNQVTSQSSKDAKHLDTTASEIDTTLTDLRSLVGESNKKAA